MDCRVLYQRTELDAASRYRTGISLHSHTNQSRESLDFIVNLGRKIPWIASALDHKVKTCKRNTGVSVDLERSYWTPPLTPRMALDLERRQITEELGLNPLVSISDHDNIEAPAMLAVVEETKDVPISVEWSAPFQDMLFHFGIHNLPPAKAGAIMSELAAYTENPQDTRMGELLDFLHSMPEVLIILNHPLWDLYDKGMPMQLAALNDLLKQHSNLIHALELNGLRDWEENRNVRRLAEGWNMLVISGGDRHGCEPNATLSLTNASSFAEFVHEVRRDRRSHVLLMRQYGEPMALRVLQTVLDVIRDYPSHAPGSRRWDGRVFHPQPDGTYLPVSAMWHTGPPKFIEIILAIVRLLERRPIRSALRNALRNERKEREVFLALGSESSVLE
ncbi:MAG TPA: hypothetical protein VKZ53_23155 [Candidatus Angelobacter sp.]|nr:hypothetical protein [Candidatus Angelobacter sp.]